MGYNTYLTSFKKKEAESFRHLDFDNLLLKFKEHADFDGSLHSFYDIPSKEIYGFGSQFDINKSLRLEAFFSNDKTFSHYEYNQVYIMKENTFLSIIEDFEDLIIEHLQLTRTPTEADYFPFENNPIDLNLDKIMNDKFILKRIVNQYISKCLNWENKSIINKHKHDDYLSYSSSLEHVIFDLAALHKSFDFEDNYLVTYSY